jgi:hypothetical protein
VRIDIVTKHRRELARNVDGRPPARLPPARQIFNYFQQATHGQIATFSIKWKNKTKQNETLKKSTKIKACV